MQGIKYGSKGELRGFTKDYRVLFIKIDILHRNIWF